MKICMLVKYPPVQGSVSMLSFWTARMLAARGHEVHVVTNARDVEIPHRMHMRPEDWAFCEGSCGDGHVRVHWADPPDRSQARVPRGRSHVTKLASLALEAVGSDNLDIVYSFYTEPYAVAGHIAAQMAGIPHVVRPAGTDTSRLWRHPQYACLFDALYRNADAVIAGPAVAERMREIGVGEDRLFRDTQPVGLSSIFAAEGPGLDVPALVSAVRGGDDDELKGLVFGTYDPDRSYFGIYGKLRQSAFPLLAALKRLDDRGCKVGLLAMAHAPSSAERQGRFRERLHANGMESLVVQIPYLPHWRVPEFIRACVAVCRLEEGSPPPSPLTAWEAMALGACLVGSSRVISGVTRSPRMADGENCVIVDDVNDVGGLALRLKDIVEDPEKYEEIGVRGRDLMTELERGNSFPSRIEDILRQVMDRRGRSVTRLAPAQPETGGP